MKLVKLKDNVISSLGTNRNLRHVGRCPATRCGGSCMPCGFTEICITTRYVAIFVKALRKSVKL